MLISILAGNPRVEIADGAVYLDAQLRAFEAAMRLAKERRDVVAKIAVAFDYKGKKESLIDSSHSLSNAQKKHLRMSSLRTEIRAQYEEFAARYNIDLAAISVILEQNCYDDIRRSEIDDPRFYRQQASACGQVNCEGVTASIMSKLSKHAQNGDIHAFWEMRPGRVEPSVISKGTMLALEKLGVRCTVIETMLYPDTRRPMVREYWYNEEDGLVEVA